MSAMVVALEKFKSILPECVATYVAEKQATSESVAAVLVDEYELTHKAHMRSFSVTQERQSRSLWSLFCHFLPLQVLEDLF